MGEKDEVILHGMWASTYSKRVELALKVKGIQYKYVEEDLMNKSELLLQRNPVHKKVPVLVHNGKPIAESMVILEYVDETWKDGPRLLPTDPYERAKVRFWSGFVEQAFQTMFPVVKSEGEAQARAVEEVHEKLKLLEDGLSGRHPGGVPSFNGDNLGLLDIILCSTFGPHEVHKEVLGIKFLDQEKYPAFTSRVNGLNELPLVKEMMPPHDELVAHLHFVRNRALNQPAATA